MNFKNLSYTMRDVLSLAPYIFGALLVFYLSISITRFMVVNDCLTKIQTLKKLDKVIVWDDKNYCALDK